MNKFAERLKELRLEEGLSQDKLAKKVGLSNAAIAHWELNNRVPTIDSAIVLAQYFKVSLDYLVGLVD